MDSSSVETERARDPGSLPVLPIGLVGLVMLYLIASSGLAASQRGDWLTLSGLAAGAVLLAALTITLARWFGRKEIVDPETGAGMSGRAAFGRVRTRLCG